MRIICSFRGHIPQDYITDGGKTLVQCKRCGLENSHWDDPIIGRKTKWALASATISGALTFFTCIQAADVNWLPTLGLVGVSICGPLAAYFGGNTNEPE